MNKITRILINSALSILKRLVLDKIQYAPVKNLLEATYLRLKDVAQIVTDNDNDNAKQLQVYWNGQKFLLAGDAVATARDIVLTEFKDEAVRDIVVELLNQVEEALKNPN